jgi:DNA-binding response OmpR family regulator
MKGHGLSRRVEFVAKLEQHAGPNKHPRDKRGESFAYSQCCSTARRARGDKGFSNVTWFPVSRNLFRRTGSRGEVRGLRSKERDMLSYAQMGEQTAAQPAAAQVVVASEHTEWASTVCKVFEELSLDVAACNEEEIGEVIGFGFQGLLVLVQGPKRESAAERVKILRQSGKRCPVLILCADNGPEAAAELLEAGADDYVCLPFNGRELAARARALIRRSSDQWLIPGSRTEVRIDPDKRTVQVGPKSVKLTPTEFAIFQYLAERPGMWISSDRIISEVIGTHHAPRTALVRVHVHHIRRKLGDCGWCVRAEHGRGYMLSV